MLVLKVIGVVLCFAAMIIEGLVQAKLITKPEVVRILQLAGSSCLAAGLICLLVDTSVSFALLA